MDINTGVDGKSAMAFVVQTIPEKTDWLPALPWTAQAMVWLNRVIWAFITDPFPAICLIYFLLFPLPSCSRVISFSPRSFYFLWFFLSLPLVFIFFLLLLLPCQLFSFQTWVSHKIKRNFIWTHVFFIGFLFTSTVPQEPESLCLVVLFPWICRARPSKPGKRGCWLPRPVETFVR